MADVFISYKREDRRWAERVNVALNAAGYTTWWDTSLVAGEHFNEAIDRELNAARCVVVIWSSASVMSRWVQAEAIHGFERGALVAGKIDDVPLRYPFSVVQTVDLRAGHSGVVDGVAAKLGLMGGAPHAVKPERRRDGQSTKTPLLRTLNQLATSGPASPTVLTASIALVAFGFVLELLTLGTEMGGELYGLAILGGVGSAALGAVGIFRFVSRRSYWWGILVAIAVVVAVMTTVQLTVFTGRDVSTVSAVIVGLAAMPLAIAACAALIARLARA